MSKLHFPYEIIFSLWNNYFGGNKMAKISKDDNNYIYYWVGKNIKKYRKQKGITQRELADLGN